MDRKLGYVFNVGQVKEYAPGEAGIVFPQTPFVQAPRVNDLPKLEIHPRFSNCNYAVIQDDTDELIDVTSEMLDWWWANMEKGYLLWAPGEHFGFDWVKAPCEVGYEGSIEASYEFVPDMPLYITRENMREYPFTECFEHCWLASTEFEGIKFYLVHMYQNVPGGCHWRTVRFMNKDQVNDTILHFGDSEGRANHMVYEAGRLRYFLPQLYALWQGHPDPWQNMQFNLTTKKNEDGTWGHEYKNMPPGK